MSTKKIVFLSGTRADFGKIKSLIQILENHQNFEPFVFVTGMHLMHKYGLTLIEIEKCNFSNLHTFSNHTSETTMDLTLAKTIEGFSAYIKDIQPDLIVVHGDRVEALSGAIVGALNNIKVAHIEGGEVSGTIDELIRHSVSKMSHIHYVSNEKAKTRLLQMGESSDAIYTIGSPDVDIMFSKDLPSLETVKKYYGILFDKYSIVMFHPVTTEVNEMKKYAEEFVSALLDANNSHNYVVIYPNNDLGAETILEEYKRLENNSRFKIYPSLRFEYFLVLLKNSNYIIGNSSAGIREAPYYGLPTINVGTRQNNRSLHNHILNTTYEKVAILAAIDSVVKVNLPKDKSRYGEGNSCELFLESLLGLSVWKTSSQKKFIDL